MLGFDPPQPLSTSLPSRNEAVGADGVARGSQSSALTSSSCPWPHRSEPHIHHIPLLLHSSGASPGAPQLLQLCWQLCLSLSCALQIVSPTLLCAPLSCSSQQHPNKPLREQPVYRPVTSSSAPASPALPPPWAASALHMCFWLGCAKGVLGDCAAPFHADPCHLCEPSPAMGEWGRTVVVPVTWCRSNWQGQGRARR